VKSSGCFIPSTVPCALAAIASLHAVHRLYSNLHFILLYLLKYFLIKNYFHIFSFIFFYVTPILLTKENKVFSITLTSQPALLRPFLFPFWPELKRYPSTGFLNPTSLALRASALPSWVSQRCATSMTMRVVVVPLVSIVATVMALLLSRAYSRMRRPRPSTLYHLKSVLCALYKILESPGSTLYKIPATASFGHVSYGGWAFGFWAPPSAFASVCLQLLRPLQTAQAIAMLSQIACLLDQRRSFACCP